EVVVQPRRSRKAEQRSVVAGLEEHEPFAQACLERLPVLRWKVVEAGGVLPFHRQLVQPNEALEARGRDRDRRFDSGVLRLAHEPAVVAVHALEGIALAESPGDRAPEPLDAHSRARLTLIADKRV